MMVDYRCTCAGARGNPLRLCGVNHPDCAALRGTTRHQTLPPPAIADIFVAMVAAADAPGEAPPAVATAATSVRR